MLFINITVYQRLLLFFSILLFLISYLFQNIFLTIEGLSILIFLIYTKNIFRAKIGNIIVKREVLEKQIFAKQPVNVRTTIENKGGFIKLDIEDVLPDNSKIFDGKNKTIKHIKKGETITLSYQIKFLSRGKQEFPGVILKLFDLYNLYNINIKKVPETIVWVHSDPKEIQKAKRITKREHVQIDAPSLFGLHSMYELDGIRVYQPGDRLKDIEWKATSRLNKIMTKLFEKKEILDTYILLDCSSSMKISAGSISKIDHASKISIHLTKILQSFRHNVGLIAFDEFKIIKKINSTKNYNQIFKNLTDLPKQLKIDNYQIKKPIESNDSTNCQSASHQRYISTIFPFLVKERRMINDSSQASGIYESLRHLMIDNTIKHLIFITDMENNIQSLYRTINIAAKKGYKLWLLTFFSPFYNITKNELDTLKLEDVYMNFSIRENIFKKLKKLNIDVVDLTPKTEGVHVFEKIRGKKK